MWIRSKRTVYYTHLRRDRTTSQESFGFIFKVLILTIAPVILSSTVYNIQNVIDSAMFSSIMSAQGFSEKHCAALLGSLGQYYTLFNVPLFMANALGSSIAVSYTHLDVYKRQ